VIRQRVSDEEPVMLSSSTRTSNKLSALFVDDNLDVLECFGRYFETAGVDVAKAADAGGAIATAIHARPDVIVLDVALPGLNGLDVLDALRLRQDTAQIPIVLFTGLPVEDVAQARRVDACVQKPCTPKALLGLVRLLGGRA
jgi:CheY-like chemotaxis protein